jgi:hypothetical protein
MRSTFDGPRPWPTPLGVGILLFAGVAFGCGAPAPTPLPSTSIPPSSPSTGAPPASATPAATPPAELARTVSAERDGIRITIELERNPLRAGEPSWVKVRVKNEGTTDVTWFHDGCANLAHVYGRSLVDRPMGVQHEGKAAAFKAYALGGWLQKAPSPQAAFSFVREEHLHSGPPGCADVGISDTTKPGERLEQIFWWSGTDANRAPPPDGPATILGDAGYYWRGAEPDDIAEQAFQLEFEAWIINDETAELLSPAEAVDAALTDATFAAYLETQAIANGRAQIVWYDARRALYEVGVMPWYETDPPRIHGVLVDAVTGAIIGPLDRPWDRDVDPFPW